MRYIGLLVLIIIALVTAGCTDEENAKRVLSAQGFTNITFTGYAPFACSQDDVFHTGFEATSVNGTRVSGTVCSGVLKGSTVRF
jgi:hypothetical protein